MRRSMMNGSICLDFHDWGFLRSPATLSPPAWVRDLYKRAVQDLQMSTRHLSEKYFLRASTHQVLEGAWGPKNGAQTQCQTPRAPAGEGDAV